MATSTRGLGLHIVANEVTADEHKHLPPILSCQDHLTRLARLCAAVGIQKQQILSGAEATRQRVNQAFDDAAAYLGPDDLLLLTFAGHSLQGDSSAAHTRWCIYNDSLTMTEVGTLFSKIPVTTSIVVVSSTCHAGALSRLGPLPHTLVLLAACGEDQWMLNRRRSEFVMRLTELIYPGGARSPHCSTYAWLRDELQKDVPDVERPYVWTNNDAAWLLPPLDLLRASTLQTGTPVDREQMTSS